MRAHICRLRQYGIDNMTHLCLNSALFCGIIFLGLITPSIYNAIQSLPLRLFIVLDAVILTALMMGFLYKKQYLRLYDKAIKKGALKHAWIFPPIAVLLVAISFLLFTLLVNVLPFSMQTHYSIIVYGSYALAIALFPLVCLLLFLPALSPQGAAGYYSLFVYGIRKTYAALLVAAISLALVNVLLSLITSLEILRMAFGLLLSVMMWCISWECCLQCYRGKIALES